MVADLTSETFVRAIASYRHFDPGRGTARAWLIGIARNVFRRHASSVAEHREVIQRLGSQVVLGEDDVEEVAARIDAQSAARALLARTAGFPELERVALELVDVMQMSPKEAADVVGVSAGVLRVRLFRARGRLRKEGDRWGLTIDYGSIWSRSTTHTGSPGRRRRLGADAR